MDICELPIELRLHILGFLDWTTLGRVGQVNKEFLDLSRTPSLYRYYEQQYDDENYKRTTVKHLSHALFRDNLKKLYLGSAEIFSDFPDISFKSLEELCLKKKYNKYIRPYLTDLTADNIRRFAPNIKTLRVLFPIDGQHAVRKGLLSILDRSTKIILEKDDYQLRQKILESGFKCLTRLKGYRREDISGDLSNLTAIGSISESELRSLPPTVRSIDVQFNTGLFVDETESDESEELLDEMESLSLSPISTEAALPIEEILFHESDYRILWIISDLIDKSTCRDINLIFKYGYPRSGNGLSERLDFPLYFTRLMNACEQLRSIYLDFHELFGGTMDEYLDIICESKSVDTLEELSLEILDFEGVPFTASELSNLSRLKNLRYFFALNVPTVSYEDVKKVFPNFVVEMPRYRILIKHPSY